MMKENAQKNCAKKIVKMEEKNKYEKLYQKKKFPSAFVCWQVNQFEVTGVNNKNSPMIRNK